MQPDQVFQLCNTLAMAGWIILITTPFWKNADKFLIGILITLFAVIYAWLIFSVFRPSDFKSFGSLDGVMQLFQNKTALTAGWVHYLAFDLMTGIFIRKNARIHGVSNWLVIPTLVLTFMLGPFGLLVYLTGRWLITGQYFAENYS
jgi:hypothetical protein